MEKGPLNNMAIKDKEKVAITAIKYSAPDRAILFSFYSHPQPLWVWADGTSISPRKLNLHVDAGGRVKASIKREVSNPEKWLGKRPRTRASQAQAMPRRKTSWANLVHHEHHDQPLSGDPSLSAHALQILLFGPLTSEPNTSLGSLQIESLQLAPSVGKTYVLAQAVVRAPVKQGPTKAPPSLPAARCCCPNIKFH